MAAPDSRPARKRKGADETGAGDGPALPPVGEVARIVRSPRNARARSFVERLAAEPPQTLLIEGGGVSERLAFALYWACSLNCPAAAGAPCLECDECRRLLEGRHVDLFVFDGRAESIKIDDLRAIRAQLGEAPRHAKRRAVLLVEAQSMGSEAANSQLKLLEDPREGTCFVLTAPQRERLLPTLVSRSLVLTLAWPRGTGQPDGAGEPDNGADAEWRSAFAAFLRNGTQLLSRTGVKGALDKNAAVRLVVWLQGELARAAARGAESGPDGGKKSPFSGCAADTLRKIDEMLADCLDSLEASVNPTLCVEWLATALYQLLRTQERAKQPF